MTERDTLPERASAREPSAIRRREENGPPCRRCRGRVWDIEVRSKAPVRRLLEFLFAAPDVLIFQSESAGWPGRQYESWTCSACGRRARVPV